MYLRFRSIHDPERPECTKLPWNDLELYSGQISSVLFEEWSRQNRDVFKMKTYCSIASKPYQSFNYIVKIKPGLT